MTTTTLSNPGFFNGHRIAFIGGGNMAGAMIGGLLRQGVSPSQIMVVEPNDQARDKLQSKWSVLVLTQADRQLQDAVMLVWATKPQVLQEAITQTLEHLSPTALHLSIAAGVSGPTLQRWLGSQLVVRAMPNTPALIGKGMTGLFAMSAVQTHHKEWVNDLVATLGQGAWLDHESALDAVTALSGSGPAYVFMFAKALVAAGVQMGLDEALARRLVVATLDGATALASQSDETLETLMNQVTSKGGTTYAALTAMQALGVDKGITEGAHAAQRRSVSLGQELDRE